MKLIALLRKVLLRLGLVLGSLAFTLLLLEILVRLFYPQQLILLRPDIWQAVEDGRGHGFVANQDTRINTGEREIRLITDAEGFRIGQTAPEPNPEIKILAIGDSFLEALQVNYEDSMTGILEQNLAAELGTSVRIYNSGISGYQPNHYAIVAEQELSETDYDMLIVFVYVGNDAIDEVVDAYPARESRLRHFRMPRALTKEELIDSVLYPMNNVLESHSQLYILFRNRSRTLLAGFGLTATYFPETLLVSNREAAFWDITINRLADIEQMAKRYDSPVLFVLIPTDSQVLQSNLAWRMEAFDVRADDVDTEQASAIFVPRMEVLGLPLLDLLPVLRQADEKQVRDLYGEVDAHLGLNGHRLVAESLLPMVLQILEE
jgi:hypothetical protein